MYLISKFINSTLNHEIVCILHTIQSVFGIAL